MGIKLFIFIADSWGVKEGGINSFNYDLTCACARAAKNKNGCKICCVIPALPYNVCRDMERNHIIPITLQKEDFEAGNASEIIVEKLKEQPRLKRVFPGKCQTFVIGHDIYTGRLAEQCSVACNGWSVVFHHMDYPSYYIYKNPDIKKYGDKVDDQKSILCEADLVCAVGPKLLSSAKDKVRSKVNLEVLEVIPGIADFEAIEPVAERYNPIVFGRVEEGNQKVKQISLAIHAYAKAIAKDKGFNVIGSDSTLYVIGYQNDNNEDFKDEVQRLNENAYKIANKMCNVVPMAYITDREKLEERISEASVAMMLSFHEGFGLVGYEAIAAGIPVIISKNTGLYQFLAQRELSHYVYCVDIEGSFTAEGYSDRDLEDVSTALIQVRKDEKNYKKKALDLREILRSKSDEYSWDAVAGRFMEQVCSAFQIDLSKNEKKFYDFKELRLADVPGYEKGIISSHLQHFAGKHIFKAIGSGALYAVVKDLQVLFADDRYEALVYNIATLDHKSDVYEYFVTDCQDYFGSSNSNDGLNWFVENELAGKLQGKILVLNHFPKEPSGFFDSLFSILERSPKDFFVFAVLDSEPSVSIRLLPYQEEGSVTGGAPSSERFSQPCLSASQQLLVKILSFLNRAYTKKVIKYLGDAINLYLKTTANSLASVNISDEEHALNDAGLIEEFSAYSYQNTRLLCEMAPALEIDNKVYALGIFKIGQYYSRCYHFNKNMDSQLNWGVFSCQCFQKAISINPEMAKEIKTEYELILSDMRFKFKQTAQYARYIHLLEGFLGIYEEPEDLWLWYHLLHCQSIFQPEEKTLDAAHRLLHGKMEKLDFSKSYNVELYLQFIRLCAELENDLGRKCVIKDLLERKQAVSLKGIKDNIWSQFLASLISIAIDQGEFRLAVEKIGELKGLEKRSDLFPRVTASALGITLEIVRYTRGITDKLEGDLSELEKAYRIAQKTLRDVRSQTWIAGLWGEYLLLEGDRMGEKKIKCSLLSRKRSEERSKSYRDWLNRISVLGLAPEIQELVSQELMRTGARAEEG